VAINDGIGKDVRPPFPGIETGIPNHAPGSRCASGAPADDIAAGPVSLPMIGAWQESSRYDGGATSTMMAGQTDDSAISPGPAGAYGDTGAGAGRGSHYPRRDWQQAAT
jgi:hypothetical protein